MLCLLPNKRLDGVVNYLVGGKKIADDVEIRK
jgi:hypothetical protein